MTTRVQSRCRIMGVNQVTDAQTTLTSGTYTLRTTLIAGKLQLNTVLLMTFW